MKNNERLEEIHNELKESLEKIQNMNFLDKELVFTIEKKISNLLEEIDKINLNDQ